MALNTLDCDLCENKTGIRHTTTSLVKQEDIFDGHHIHICGVCYDERYKKIDKALKIIEDKILQDIKLRYKG